MKLLSVAADLFRLLPTAYCQLVRLAIIILLPGLSLLWPQKLLIPMDATQRDHLKAYGVTFWTLKRNVNVEWLLNYRGGSFLTDALPEIEYPSEYQVRRVRSNGQIRWQGKLIFISEVLIGQRVGLIEVNNGTWRLDFGAIQLALYDEQTRKIRPI